MLCRRSDLIGDSAAAGEDRPTFRDNCSGDCPPCNSCMKRSGFRSESQQGRSEHAQDVRSRTARPCRARGLRPSGPPGRSLRSIDPCGRTIARCRPGDAADRVPPPRSHRSGRPGRVARGGGPTAPARTGRGATRERDTEGRLSAFRSEIRPPHDEIISFIDMNREQIGIKTRCCSLGATECGFIASRGDRAAKTRPASVRSVRCEILIAEVRRIHRENHSFCGVREMWRGMRHAGWDAGRNQVERLMKVAASQGVRRGRKPVTIHPAVEDAIVPTSWDARSSGTGPGSSGSPASPAFGCSPDSGASHSSPMSDVAELSPGRSRPPSARSICHCWRWSAHFSQLGQAELQTDRSTFLTGVVHIFRWRIHKFSTRLVGKLQSAPSGIATTTRRSRQ